MRAIYIGSGQARKNNNSSMTKVYFFLILFLVIVGAALKLSASLIVERWINQNGSGDNSYAFSIRDVEIKFAKGQMVLLDLKVFNPKTSAKIVEAPAMTIKIDWQDLLMYQDKKISIDADKVDLILSKDFSSEMKRIQSMSEKHTNDFYIDVVEAKFAKLNIIEQKEDLSRTVIELNDVVANVKDLSLLSINKKTVFNVSSNLADGGKFQLSGKTIVENGNTPWSIQGSFKQVPTDIFNKMAGDKLPFTFNESRLNADISAHSENGKVIGEISPEIRKVNLLNEKPGVPTQTIARLLTDELTFTLPFTLKEELTLQYQDTFQKLKTYRKDPAPAISARAVETKVTQTSKSKKPFSFWPF